MLNIFCQALSVEKNVKISSRARGCLVRDYYYCKSNCTYIIFLSLGNFQNFEYSDFLEILV